MKQAAGYRPSIDGLRALAVLVVIIFHAFPTLLSGGFIGVDVFFVISGYLITGIVTSDMERGKFSFKDFYYRRIRRIFPALIVVLLATLLIGWGLLLPADYEQLGKHALAGAFFVPNLIFWREVGYFDAVAETKPLLHLWSLGIEEQFYLVWPVVLLAFAKRRNLIPAMLAIAMASLIYSVYASIDDPAAGFYSPVSRLWELALGGVLAVAKPRLPSWTSPIGIALILVSALAYTKGNAFPGLLALIPTGGAALVIASNSSRLLSSKPLVWLGLISYPLYLWHWPLLSFARTSGADTPLVRICILGTSVLLAWATYQYVEKEFRFRRLRSLSVPIALSSMVVIAIFAALVVTTGGVRARFPTDILTVLDFLKYDAADQARVPECWLTSSAQPEEYSSVCSKGSILIWGDSHAARLYTGLAAISPHVAQFTRDSCLPILRNGQDTCDKSNVVIMETIHRVKPHTVILFAAWLNHWQDWGDSWPDEEPFRQTVRQLRKAGIEDIQVLGPAPIWEPNLPKAIYEYWRSDQDIPERLPPAEKQYRDADVIIGAITKAEGGRFFSVHDALCDKRGCLTHTPSSKGDLLSWDYGHFTTAGATFVAQTLGLDAGSFGSSSEIRSREAYSFSASHRPNDSRQLGNERLDGRLLTFADHHFVEFGIGINPDLIAPGDESRCLGSP